MNKQKEIAKRRARRRFHVRKSVRGSAETPRMTVDRTLKHISVQLIDDVNGRTLASISTRDQDVRGQVKYGGNCDAATVVGKLIAERAKQGGVQSVRFDRGDCKYHGRVAALANAAREAGLKF